MTGIFEGMCFFMENRRDHVSFGERGKKRRGVHSQAGIGYNQARVCIGMRRWTRFSSR